MNNHLKKTLIITTSILVAIAIIVGLWFVFDFSSKIDVLKHPEKYSFRMNFNSFIMQNDYYLYAKYDSIKSIWGELKTTEKKYESKTDETSLRIYRLNNLALDLYHDLLSLNMPKMKISTEDFIFLNKHYKTLANFFFYMYATTWPELEKKSILYAELNMRKEAITVVRKDMKDRKINAVVTLDDVKYENLTPAYLSDNKPSYTKEFQQEFLKNTESIGKDLYKSYEQALKNAKSDEETTKIQLDYANRLHSRYISWLDNLNIKWKHRYVITAIEYKNNKEDKITHLYEIYPYKEGNRIYWNLQYHSPNSEFIKAYFKMLELLINY